MHLHVHVHVHVFNHMGLVVVVLMQEIKTAKYIMGACYLTSFHYSPAHSYSSSFIIYTDSQVHHLSLVYRPGIPQPPGASWSGIRTLFAKTIVTWILEEAVRIENFVH